MGYDVSDVRALMSKPLDGLRICYFGHYDPEYSRNRIIQKVLRRAGAEVIDVNDHSVRLRRYYNLSKKIIREHFDLMIVGFMGHTDVPLAKLICRLRRAPLVFDVFISLYDTYVIDRGHYKPGSLMAHKLYYTDAIALRLADRVLLDTDTHIRYFKNTFGISERKFRRIWIGADDEVFRHQNNPVKNQGFTVLFFGTFIPLQGIEHIIAAASILERSGEDVRFVLAGSGQTYSRMREAVEREGIRNVDFLGRVVYENLPALIQRSDLCLGIFGTTPKAGRVIPNKVFESLAMSRCVITADTQAIGEALTHGENIWLVESGSGEQLAEAISTLKRDKPLRERIAKNGYEFFKQNFSLDALEKDVVRVVEEVLTNPMR